MTAPSPLIRGVIYATLPSFALWAVIIGTTLTLTGVTR